MLDSYCDSDEEIFFGRMTLKEVKRSVRFGRLTEGKSPFRDRKQHDKRDVGFKLIQAKSEPNLLVKHSPDGSIRCSLASSGIGSDTLFDENEMCLDEIEEELFSRFAEERSIYEYLPSGKNVKQRMSSFTSQEMLTRLSKKFTFLAEADGTESHDESDNTITAPNNSYINSNNILICHNEINNDLADHTESSNDLLSDNKSIETAVDLKEIEATFQSDCYNDCDLDTTLERMERILRYGDELIKTPIDAVSPEQKRKAKIHNQPVNISKSKPINLNPVNISPLPSSSKSRNRIDPGTPWPFKSLHQSRLNKSKYSPGARTPIFAVPTRPVSRLLRPGFFSSTKTPPRIKVQSTAANSLQEMISPVGYYINHSPLVPKIKNIHPMKLLQSLNDDEEIEQSNCKENIVLPAKAYRPAKTTKLIDQTPPSGLPKNNQVKKMVDKLSKPQVIRHEKREILQPIKQFTTVTKTTQHKPSTHPRADDSFANLSVVTGDVSIHVRKQAFRTLPTNKP